MSQSMFRALLAGPLKTRRILTAVQLTQASRRWAHDEIPRPFDNMPFSVPNRFVATVFFAVFFGVGLWAPFIIVWYAMAKRTM